MSLPAFRAALDRLVKDDRPDLTLRQLCLLIDCTSAGPQTVRDMAARLGVSKPAITRGADRLTELGLLKRTPDQRDRRSVLVCATSGGHKLVTAVTVASIDADMARAA